jgi:hypothetical protein
MLRGRPSALVAGTFALAALTLAACLPKTDGTDKASDNQDSSQSTDNSAEAADKPAPIAGAYLTCVLTKPAQPDALDAGCQVRTSVGARVSDPNVDPGTWSYVPPAGASGFAVSLVRLTKVQGHTYYYHALFRTRRVGAGPNANAMNDAGLAVFAGGLTPVYQQGRTTLAGLNLKAATLLASKAKPNTPAAVPREAEISVFATIDPTSWRLAPPVPIPPSAEQPTSALAPAAVPPSSIPITSDAINAATNDPQSVTQVISTSDSWIDNSSDITADTATNDELDTDTSTDTGTATGTDTSGATDPTADATSTAKDTDGDGIPDTDDKCPNTPPDQVANIDRNPQSARYGCAPSETARVN